MKHSIMSLRRRMPAITQIASVLIGGLLQINEDAYMIHNLNEITGSIFTSYMPRSRIERIFTQTACGKLLYVIAGSGYGKTQTVRHYIKQQTDAVILWIQLTESDNVTSCFWESFMHSISADNPNLAFKLLELGFPETLARFKQFAEILKNTEQHPPKIFMVMDDFHLIHSKHIRVFAERCIYLKKPEMCVIIISRHEPEINAVPLFAKGQAGIITEGELRFTEGEIAAFMNFQKIPFSAENLPKFYNATKGWILGVQLLSLALKRMPENIDYAINIMKTNIFKLFEAEAFNDFPENIKKIMVKLALVSDVPLAPLYGIINVDSFLQDNPQLMSFVWFNSLSGDYRVHPLYFEFLQSKHSILSNHEKLDAYHQAAQWCFENNFKMDAMRYFAKVNQFDRMLEIFFSYPLKLPHDACEHFLNILNSLEPENDKNSDFNILLLKNYFIPLMLIGVGKYEDAEKLTYDIIREWENADTPFASTLLYFSYSNLAYIDMYTCTATHKYVAPEYIKKSMEYLKLSSLPPAKDAGPFSVADIRSYTCLVGEGAELSEFDQFLEAARQTVLYSAETNHNIYYGYDDLVACEIAYFKNQLDLAARYAHQTVLKAREKQQYSIEVMAKQYLLRISVHSGDHNLAENILKQLRCCLNNANFWNRQLLYDLITGLFYTLIDCPEMSPAWLTMNEKEARSEVHIPIAELSIALRNYIVLKEYDMVLTVLYNSYPRKPQERFLFSELCFSLMAAVAKIKTNDTTGAMEDFKRAYELSFGGVFEMFFIEMGKNLHPLVAAALKQTNCGIPNEWLKKIDRKASAYAKKASVIAKSLNKEKNIHGTIHLSEREQEILHDLCHGLSRDEIAESRYLSINTVKKILQSIYIKLDANNNADAVRIAIEKKLVK